MNDTNAFERFVADQFDQARDAVQANDSALDDITREATRTHQRPRWLALIKEPPMRISSSLAVGSPTARVVAIMVATLLITISIAGAGLAGARLFAAEEDEGFLSQFAAVPFTGKWIGEMSGPGPSDWKWRLGPGYAVASDSLEHERVVAFEASDPRINGTWTQVDDMRSFAMYLEDEDVEDPFIATWRSAIRIENEHGAWAGTLDGFKVADGNGPEWYNLAGEGAYRGMTALFRWIPEDDVYDGVIVPGEVPDYPPPIEPSTVAVESEAPAE